MRKVILTALWPSDSKHMVTERQLCTSCVIRVAGVATNSQDEGCRALEACEELARPASPAETKADARQARLAAVHRRARGRHLPSIFFVRKKKSIHSIIVTSNLVFVERWACFLRATIDGVASVLLSKHVRAFSCWRRGRFARAPVGDACSVVISCSRKGCCRPAWSSDMCFNPVAC